MFLTLALTLFTSIDSRQDTTLIENKTGSIIAITTINDDLTSGGIATSRTILKPNQFVSISDQEPLSVWQISFTAGFGSLIHYGEYLHTICAKTLQETDHIKIYKSRIEIQ